MHSPGLVVHFCHTTFCLKLFPSLAVLGQSRMASSPSKLVLYFLYIVLTGYFGRFVKRKQGGRTETQNVSVPPRRSTRRVHTPPPTHPPLTTLVRRRCAKSHFNPSQAGARFLVLCFRALMVATAQVQLAVNTSPRASHTQHDCLRPSRFRASPRCLPSGQTIMAQRLQQQASRLGCQREPLWCPSTTIL